MKKIILLILILLCSVNLFANKFMETDDNCLVFITQVKNSDFGTGSFKHIKSKGPLCGVIQKYTKDGSSCLTSIFGCNGEIRFIDMVKDTNGDFIVLGIANESAFGTGDLKDRKSFGNDDIIFARFSSNLKLKDVQNFGCEGKDFAYKIILDKENKFVIVGRTTYEDIDKTTAFVASFDKGFDLIRINEFNGSFVDDGDADWTEFINIKEERESGFVVIGETEKSGRKKAIILKLGLSLSVYEKTSFGNKDSVVRLEDIIEMPGGGYIAVGYCEEDVQKGYILELTPGLNKVSAQAFMPIAEGVKALYNGLYTIEPYNHYKSYFVTGVAVFMKGESTNYYTLYTPGKGFTEIVYFPRTIGANHIVGKDNTIYIIGSDDENNYGFTKL